MVPVPLLPPKTVTDTTGDDPRANDWVLSLLRAFPKATLKNPTLSCKRPWSIKSVNTADVPELEVILKRNTISTTLFVPKVNGPVKRFVGGGLASSGPVVNIVQLPETPPDTGRIQYCVDLTRTLFSFT